MQLSRIFSAIDAKLNSMEFQEIRHALPMMGCAFIPIVGALVTFQFGVMGKSLDDLMGVTARSKIAGHDLSLLFNYYTAWMAHMVVSIGVTLLAARSAYRNRTAEKVADMMLFAIMAAVVTMFFLVVLDALHCKLAVLTHERIFSVLSREPSLGPLFQQKALFTWFSLFPIVSVGSAFLATATIIMCASKTLVDLKRAEDKAATDTKAHADKKVNARIAAFSDALETLRSHVLALSFVLVTSTLGTVAYLRIPLGLLADADRHSFKAVSDAIGLVWGVTFSLTLLALCVYPFNRLRTHFGKFGQYAHVTHSKVLEQWLKENGALLQVPANLQLVLSVLLPATVAVVTNLVST